MKQKKITRPALLPPDNVRRRYASSLPPGQVLAIEVLFALRAGFQGVDNALSRWMGSDALTPGRWQVLVVLWSAARPMPQREIVEALKVSRATVSGLVEMLLAEGHVTATADAQDKRRILVALTPDGRIMTERLVHENAERLRGTFGALTDEELQTLAGLLARLVS